MIVYTIVFFLLFAFSIAFPYIKWKKELTTKVVFLEFFLLFILGGIRDGVGVDFYSYKELYGLSSGLYDMNEKGFVIIVKLLHDIGVPFAGFCLLLSFLTVLLVFRFSLRYSTNFFLSILMYYSLGNLYFSSFNAMRQALVVAIFINLFQIIENRKFARYFFILLLTAYCVHLSALILIPLYFCLHKKWGNKLKIIVLVSSMTLGNILIAVIEVSPYAIYLKFDAFATAVPATFYLIGFLAIITFFYAIFHSEWERKNCILSNINLLTMMLLCFIFIYERTPLVMVFNRILAYFTIVYIVILPMLITEMKLLSNRKLVIIFTSCIFLFLFHWALYRGSETNCLIPYKTIFYD